VSTRTRTEALTADLLHDIADEEAAPLVSAPPKRLPSGTAGGVDAAPAAFLETALFLTPRTWLRPAITRSGTTMSLSAGPIRLRAGRG
jgi:hypothetical protein